MAENYFDTEAADHVQEFIETLCTFTKGEMAGEPMILSEWQRDEVVRPAFGWKRPDGYRVYKEIYVEIPKKNSKSHLGAALALYLLFGDGEKGAEVIAGAADREQARIVYNIGSQMIENSELSNHAKVMQRAILHEAAGSSFKAISHESNTKHGYDISGLFIDEIHAHKDRQLYDTLQRGTASRKQPITFIMTTAGVADPAQVGYQMHNYAIQVRDGHIKDEAFLPVIHGANEDDDPFSKKTWEKANPNLYKSVDPDYIKREANKAKVDPASLVTFKRLHLNIWTNSETSFFSKEQWEGCNLGEVTEQDMEGKRCFIGLDLSSTEDFTAIVCAFPGENGCDILPYFFIPEDTVDARVISSTLFAWKQSGYLETTDGNVIDTKTIYTKLHYLTEKFKVQEIAYDPYGANPIIGELDAEGIECVAFRQGWKSMSPAMKETKRQILSGNLNHGGNPVLAWMNSNLMVKEDEAGNVQPHKGKSRDRIDGVVAMFMAVDRAMAAKETDKGPRVRVA